MVLDVGPLLRGEVKTMRVNFSFAPDPIPDVVFPSDASFEGIMREDAGLITLNIHCSLPYRASCARCLAPVEGVFSLDLERTAVTEGTLTEEQLEDGFDQYVEIRRNQLDMDEMLREELSVCFPMRVLCSEDCPGLCPKCGKPLREGPCGCSQIEIDPRWQKLGEMFDEKMKNEK